MLDIINKEHLSNVFTKKLTVFQGFFFFKIKKMVSTEKVLQTLLKVL